MTYLQLSGVSKAFGRATAVNGFDLSIEQGESVVLLGPSGCGKTTCLRMIAGFERPDQGEIVLDGRTLVNRSTFVPPEKRHMAVMFQSYALWPHMTVFDNVAYGPRTARMKRADVDAKVESVLELVGLNGFGRRFPHQLSGGQQQRVAMARALVTDPSVLLLDEPLSNLDTRLRQEMRGQLKRISDELNITMVYVTHDQDEALSLADRLVVMHSGRIEQIGSPEEVYSTPRNRYVAKALGSTNLVESVVTKVDHDHAEIELLGGITTSVNVGRRIEPPRVGERLTVSVRPSDIGLLDPTGPTQAIVRDAIFFGDSVAYRVETGTGELLDIHGPGRSRRRAGDRVSLLLDPDALAALDD